MNTFVDKLLFINFCGQKFISNKNLNLKFRTLNVFSAQFVPLFSIPFCHAYIIFGFKNPFGAVFIVFFTFYIFDMIFKSKIKSKISKSKFEDKIKKTPKYIILLNLFFSIIFAFINFFIFIGSFFLIKYYIFIFN
jgi:hypothetical protein